MSLAVHTDRNDHTFIIKLIGELDISTTPIVEPVFHEMGTVERVEIDFSELEFIDSTGIGLIMEAIYFTQGKEIKLILRGLNQTTHDIFDMIGVFKLLESVNGEVR